MLRFLTRREIEKRTVYDMIRMYCRHNHGTKKGLCDSCTELYEYSVFKYDRCPFGDGKPVCSKCKIHCYSRKRREEIREVMRFAGPRMIFVHPIETIIYLFNKAFIPAPDKVVRMEKIRKDKKNDS